MTAGYEGGAAWASLSFEGRLANAIEPWPEAYQATAMAAVPSGPTSGGPADWVAVRVRPG